MPFCYDDIDIIYRYSIIILSIKLIISKISNKIVIKYFQVCESNKLYYRGKKLIHYPKNE